jgi:hypothetical protein
MKLNLVAKNLINSYLPVSHYYKSLSVRRKILETYFEVDKYISLIMSKNEPASIARLGGTEARVLGLLIAEKKLIRNWDFSAVVLNKLTYEKRIYQLKNNAGLYPVDKNQLDFFWQVYKNAILNSDLLGVWGNTFTWSENYFLEKSKTIAIPHMACSPWVESYTDSNFEPWSKSLTGKKVLVISPFSKTFAEQFEIIHRIFPSKKYHDFHPIFIQAPITQGGLEDGKSSKIHLQEIVAQISEVDFDIALISAGVYATPISNSVKDLGKIGINCGGELQLFFGVLGERWVESKKHRKYFNRYWVRPKIEERPNNWKDIENGCYW